VAGPKAMSSRLFMSRLLKRRRTPKSVASCFVRAADVRRQLQAVVGDAKHVCPGILALERQRDPAQVAGAADPVIAILDGLAVRHEKGFQSTSIPGQRDA
jgi:hypothetical protein